MGHSVTDYSHISNDIPGSEVIQLAELRLGNILKYEEDYVEVTSLSYDVDDEYQDEIGFCKLSDNRSFEKADWNRALCDKLRRIPLTPEVLRNCVIERPFMMREQTLAIWVDDMINYTGYESADGYADIAKPTYLHQLQNIIHALTNEELTVDL